VNAHRENEKGSALWNAARLGTEDIVSLQLVWERTDREKK